MHLFVSVLIIVFMLSSNLIFVTGVDDVSSRESISAGLESSNKSSEVKKIERKDIYSKHYNNDNGTYTAEIGMIPLYYEDNGELKDIDNSISKAQYQDFEYSVIRNAFKVYFNDYKSIENDIYTRISIMNSNGRERTISYKFMGGKPNDIRIKDNSFTYKSFMKNVDLEYIVQNTKLKENIIVNKPLKEYKFLFEIEYDGSLELIQQDDTYYFMDVETGEYLWMLEKPYALDSNNKTTDNVTLKHIKQELGITNKDSFYIALEDKSFIKNAKFPITIDPTTTSSTSSMDAYVLDTSGNSNYGTSSFLEFGRNDYMYLVGTGPQQYYESYIKFSLDSIPQGAKIVSASLKLTNATTYYPSHNGNQTIYRVTADWNESTIKYNNKPAYDRIGTTAYGVLIFTKQGYNESNYVDVTSIVKKWVEDGEQNYGFAFPAINWWGNNSRPMRIYSKEASTASYRPLLTITYSVAPEIISTIPVNNHVLSEFDTAFVPTITVKDADNDNLTCRYYLDSEVTPRDTKTVSETSTAKNVSFEPLDISTLSEGSHTFKFEISDTYTDPVITTISFKVDKTPPIISSYAVTSTNASITVMGMAADSIPGLALTPYRYKVGDNVFSQWIADGTYIQESFTPNTQYEIVFEARDAVGHIATASSSIYTKAVVPEIIVHNPKSYGFDIQVSDANPDNTQYLIRINSTSYITPEGTLTASPVWVTLPNKNIKVTGLNPDTIYNFTVKARNAEGIETAWSAPVSGTTLIAPPEAPVNITAAASTDSITIVWDSAANCTGYDVEVDGRIIDNGTYTAYTHTGLLPFTEHTYRVRGRNAGGTGQWSTLIRKYTQQNTPGIPYNINAAATSTSVIVTWKPVADATAYDIEVDGEVVNNSSSTNYVHTGLIPGTLHSYRVRSINSGGKSEWSNEILITTQTQTPQAPTNVRASASLGEIIVTWDEIQGATYEIEVDGSIINNGTNNMYTHINLTDGSEHSYRVRASKSGNISDWSTLVVAMVPVDAFGTPTNIKTNATDVQAILTWNAVMDATGYEVEADGEILDNGTDTSCIFSSLIPNTVYTYRVRALKDGQPSDWSEYLNITTYSLPTPVNIQSNSTESTISLTWDAVAGADSYELKIDGITIGGITGASYIHEHLAANSQHTYLIRAKNAAGTSAWSTIITEITRGINIQTPKGIIAKSTTNSIQLIWKPINDATGYEVQIDGVVIQNIAAPNFIHSGLLGAEQHSYRIRAVKGETQGEWSNIIIVMTLADAPTAPTNVSASSTTTSILVTWDAVDNAAEYEIEADGVIIRVGLNTKYMHNNISPDSTHTYRVRAINTTQQSLWSDLITANTKSSTETYYINVNNGQVFDIMFTADEIANPSQYTYTISYNPNELEVLDLCGTTARIDLNTGNIIGTDIQILQYTEGTIVFRKLESYTSQSWTGLVNSIKFKSKTDNQTQIIYSIE